MLANEDLFKCWRAKSIQKRTHTHTVNTLLACRQSHHTQVTVVYHRTGRKARHYYAESAVCAWFRVRLFVLLTYMCGTFAHHVKIFSVCASGVVGVGCHTIMCANVSSHVESITYHASQEVNVNAEIFQDSHSLVFVNGMCFSKELIL